MLQLNFRICSILYNGVLWCYQVYSDSRTFGPLERIGVRLSTLEHVQAVCVRNDPKTHESAYWEMTSGLVFLLDGEIFKEPLFSFYFILVEKQYII